VTALLGTPTVSLSFTARADGALPLTGLRVRLVSPTGSPNYPNATGPDSFTWSTNTSAGSFETFGNVSAPATVNGVLPANGGTGLGGQVTLQAAPAAPGSPLSLSFELSSPSASNTATGVQGFYSTPAVLQSWSTRFVLLWTQSRGTGATPEAYYLNEYGASVFFISGKWTVLELPASFPTY
jgi:hypothetical protein